MDQLNKFVWNHLFAEPGLVAAITLIIARIDSVILFALRFFSPDTIKAELDRINAVAKKEVDRVAAQPAAEPKPEPAPK